MKEKPQLAVVQEVGPGPININGERLPMSNKPGDLIAIKKYSPEVVELPDQTKIYLITNYDIICTIEEEEIELELSDEELESEIAEALEE